jgi:hypothetical protein
MTEPTEYSESGQPIYRHEEAGRDWTPADMSDSSMEEISDHIERHIGPVDGVLHEIVSDLVHIDVHVVKPTKKRPWVSLITSGMSDQPMTVPDECEELRYSELMINLPPSWPLEQKDWEDHDNYWPIYWLKQLARLPHEYDTWLSYGHTVPNGDPPEPFADNTDFCCMLLEFSVTAPEDFHTLQVRDDKVIHFWSLMPLYAEEVDLKLAKGTEALEERFEKEQIYDVVDLDRPNVGRRKKFFGLF